jgi:hypothetical protein
MEKLRNLSEAEARRISGGSIAAGVEFFGICLAIFYAGWECGRGLAREVKSWF